jgi:hypothetical protein
LIRVEGESIHERAGFCWRSPAPQAPQQISDIVITVRQILLIPSGIAPNLAMTAIEINETEEKVAVAGALIRALDVP